MNKQKPGFRPLFLMLSGLLGAVALVISMVGPPFPAGSALAQDDPASVIQRLPGTNGSDGYGRVKLIEEGERTRVVVAIHGPESGQFLPAIHSGTCATYQGEPLYPLAPFVAGERSRTTVDISFAETTSGGFLVDIHPVAATESELFDPQTAVACGELPTTEVVAEVQPTIAPIDDEVGGDVIVTAPPVTGFGPVDAQYWSTITAAVLAALAVAFAAAGLDLRRRAIVTVAQRRLYRLTGREL